MNEKFSSAISIGDQAPAFALDAINRHGQVSLDDYRGQSGLFLNLMRGLHCPFCRRHLTQLAKLGIHFALVSPTFGFRGCDDRRLGPCRGPARAAPPAGAVGRKAGHEPANGGD